MLAALGRLMRKRRSPALPKSGAWCWWEGAFRFGLSPSPLVLLQLVPEQYHRYGCLQAGRGSARAGCIPPQAEVSGVLICQVLSWWAGGGQRAPWLPAARSLEAVATGCSWAGVAQFGGVVEGHHPKPNMNTPCWRWAMPPPWTRGLAVPGGRANSRQVVFILSVSHLENGYHLYGLQKTPGAVPGSGA